MLHATSSAFAAPVIDSMAETRKTKMKNRQLRICFAIGALFVCVFFNRAAAIQNGNNREGQAALVDANNKLYIDRNWDDAIRLYKEIATRYATNSPGVAATALVSIGDVYAALGKRAEAIDAYEKVRTKFPGQREAVQKAQAKLLVLNTPPAKSNAIRVAVSLPSGTERGFWESGNAGWTIYIRRERKPPPAPRYFYRKNTANYRVGEHQ